MSKSLEIFHTANHANNDFDLVICCGKGLGPNGEIDWILESRIRLSLEILDKNPNAKLLLSGGVGLTTDNNAKKIPEAEAMEDYIITNFSFPKERIIKESSSTGSLGQLCIIKEDFIIANKFKSIALVTDEVHIKRMALLFDAVMGNGYNLSFYGSKINIFGKYKQAIEDYERQNYLGSAEIVKNLPRGDHKKFQIYDENYSEYRKSQLDAGSSRMDFITFNDVINYLKSKGIEI